MWQKSKTELVARFLTRNGCSTIGDEFTVNDPSSNIIGKFDAAIIGKQRVIAWRWSYTS